MVVIATNADHKDDETSKVNNVCLEGQAGETCVLDIALDSNDNSSSTSSTNSTYVQIATGTCENVGLKTIQTSSGCQAASNALGLETHQTTSIGTETDSGFPSGCYNGGSSSGVWLNYKTGNNCGTCSGHSDCSSVTTFCICEKGEGSSSPISSGSTNVTVPSNSNTSLCLAGNGGVLCAVCDPNHARYGPTKPCEQCSSLVGKAYV